jgi:hypothetical protein
MKSDGVILHIIAYRTKPSHIHQRVSDLPVPAMRDILKLLNDQSPGDLRELSDHELRSFEALCENWRIFVQAELARRAALPRQTDADAGGDSH